MYEVQTQTHTHRTLKLSNVTKKTIDLRQECNGYIDKYKWIKSYFKGYILKERDASITKSLGSLYRHPD